jgi:hypothetical protein
VQQRRGWPARVTQRIQIGVQNEVLAPVLGERAIPADIAAQPRLPVPLQVLRRLPMLTRIPARMVGIGVRPERVRTPAMPPPARQAR